MTHEKLKGYREGGNKIFDKIFAPDSPVRALSDLYPDGPQTSSNKHDPVAVREAFEEGLSAAVEDFGIIRAELNPKPKGP